jgi:hypothetical protein
MQQTFRFNELTFFFIFTFFLHNHFGFFFQQQTMGVISGREVY